MKRKHVILLVIAVFIGLFMFSSPTISSSALSAEPKSTNQPDQSIQDQIEIAILEAITSNERYIQKGLAPTVQVTDIRTSVDQKLATAWVTYYDNQIDAVLPIEPGLAIAHQVENNWQVILPSDRAGKTKYRKPPKNC